MRQDVDAGDIHRAERRALGASDRRSADRVDLFDRELPGDQELERAHHAVETDPIADEAWRVLGNDNALAERVVHEAADGVDHRWIRLGGRDDLEQAEVTRGVEEVRAQPAPTKRLRATLGDVGDRNP